MKGRKTKKRKKYNLKMHTNERKRSKKGEKENMNDEEVEGRKEGRKEGGDVITLYYVTPHQSHLSRFTCLKARVR